MNISQNKYLRILLLPLSVIYGFITAVRNKFYDLHIFRINEISGIKCISVGNITTGGTGKTPAVEYLAKVLTAKGKRVAILSRGYRRKSKGSLIVSDGKKILADYKHSGDEPQLLARNLKGVPVIVESDRFKGGLLIRNKFDPGIIILDDAFQHRRIKRNLDILMIDCTAGLEHDRMLPAGNLREPLSGLKRSDIILLTRVDQVNRTDSLRQFIKKFTNAPIIETIHQPVSLKELNGDSEFPVNAINHKTVLLFSGIGNPVAFKNTIMKLGANVVSEVTFFDHHFYAKADLQNIRRIAENKGVKWIITTEKDAIRLSSMKALDFSIYYLKIRLKIEKDETALIKLLCAS
ncbi:tetraacyldisaccharide 4'-kinase [candidate division KSB1 bacterium]|nr:tetraacyldisaccharide 4'-kinase [candidate division KSB1 bacterium]